MINTRDVCHNNNFIANDYYKGRLNNTQYTRDSTPVFTKKKSQGTLQRERITARYESRSNTCDRCYTQRSSTGTCGCEE